jgi:hypothetical protein
MPYPFLVLQTCPAFHEHSEMDVSEMASSN